MRYRDAARKLNRLGCHEVPRIGGGSHRRWFNPENQRDTVLPDWRGRDLKIGTVRAAVRQLGIDWRRFQDA
ncbi:type II toxin-antitoxin system HicA family toxin [Candidatus Poriferisodalis sp.]|uniref:type II toxin-antitoxin system HicA family toxin n=1 Tax=Candidatus Poriferisodalis sp. TaxID=3101277 RepID=UPI003B01F262